MNKQEIEKAGHDLQNTIPLIGHLIRMSAVKKLSSNPSPESIPFLVKALNLPDGKVANIASETLRSLKNQEAIDVFCKAWFSARNSVLEEILVNCGYTATQPSEIHIITHLKTGKTINQETSTNVDLLIKYLSDPDKSIKENAGKALRALKSNEAIDAFCKAWFSSRNSVLEEILVNCGYTATQPSEIHIITHLKTGKTINQETSTNVDLLIKYLSDPDKSIKENAGKALRALKSKEAIDALCKAWFSSRTSVLEEILVNCGYTATQPSEIHVITLLKTGKIIVQETVVNIELLIKFLSDKDKTITENAWIALEMLKSKEMKDFICDGIITGTFTKAVQDIALEKNYFPSAVSRRCLFYVITGQTEKYFDLDFEFGYLRAEYIAANESLQQRLREAIARSGDHRLMGMFGEVRKKFVAKELTSHEVELMVGIYQQNRQAEEIFALLFFAPLTSVPDIVSALAGTGWKPGDEGQRILMDELFTLEKQMKANAAKPTEREVALGPVFAKWIERGKKEYVAKPEKDLRDLLKTGDPPEAVSALFALIALNHLTSEDRTFCRTHPHWMVRMAYLAEATHTNGEVISGDIIDTSGGGEYWLKQSPAYVWQQFLQLRAAGLNPEHLQHLQSALQKNEATNHAMKPWASMLQLLAAYTLRNTLIIGAFEQSIEKTAIGIDKN
jgi:HEAT repeat protein